MANYQVTHPRDDVVRVAFLDGWNPETDSAPMFQELLEMVEHVEQPVILLIIAGKHRPLYDDAALQPARGVLYHDNLKKIIVVAEDAELAVAHMGASRGERGMGRVPMFAFENEGEALVEL